jgi:hypothetical protein
MKAEGTLQTKFINIIPFLLMVSVSRITNGLHVKVAANQPTRGKVYSIHITPFFAFAFVMPVSDEFRTVIQCDQCGNNLVVGNSFVSDTDENGENHVRYKCEICGTEHDYNFDIAPVPVSWKSIREQSIKE